jgi:hypothetical protein
VERRLRTRQQISHPVRLTLLGADPSSDLPVPGVVLDYSERGMRVRVPQPVPASTAIRVEIEDQILLGEACYCQSLTGGQYAVGVQLEQSLNNLEDLSRLVRALHGGGNIPEPAPAA